MAIIIADRSVRGGMWSPVLIADGTLCHKAWISVVCAWLLPSYGVSHVTYTHTGACTCIPHFLSHVSVCCACDSLWFVSQAAMVGKGERRSRRESSRRDEKRTCLLVSRPYLPYICRCNMYRVWAVLSVSCVGQERQKPNNATHHKS